MARALRIFRDFSGGLADGLADSMADKYLKKAKNTVPAAGLGLAKASGYELALPRLTSGAEILALVELTPADGVVQTLCFTADSLYQLVTAAGGQQAAWQLVTNGLAPICDYFIYGGKLWWLDGSEFRTYNGQTVAAVTFTPQTAGSPTAAELEFWGRIRSSRFVEQRGSRWFYARSTHSEVIFSKVGNPQDFELTSIISVNTKDADTITGLCSFAEGLLIFKQKSVYFLSGWDFIAAGDINLTRLSVSSGTAFAKSICRIDNGVLYLGADGLYRLHQPNYSLLPAAKNLSEKRVKALADTGELSSAHSCYFAGAYRITLVDGAGCREYRYYPATDSFFGEFTQSCSCYSTALRLPALFLGCRGGYILKNKEESRNYIDTATGQEIPIEMEAETKAFDVAGQMVRQSRVKSVFIVASQYKEESSLPELELTADYRRRAYTADLDESLIYGEGQWGAARYGFVDAVCKELPLNLKCRRLSIKIYNNKLNEPVLLLGLGFSYKSKRPAADKCGITERSVEYND